MAWTDDRVKKLKQLWNKGLSASQIAEELGDVTRNAVIGKAHRLGLSSRPSPVKQASSGKKAAKPKAKAEPAKKTAKAPAKKKAPAAKAAAETESKPAAKSTKKAAEPAKKQVAKKKDGSSERITILTLTERMCKWPIGHPGEEDFHFCGKHSEPGQPYCAMHSELAFQAPQPRKDRRRNR
ncbi:MAG: GcrA family cell cycle regulator [Alphaproteobacteria bacterium]|nr:GcrA family cell cycle regulator [Alphaproteobacteria bacterium]